MARSDETALIATEHARRAAIVRDDVEALAVGMADHFHYAHINGMVEDRAAFLARIGAKVVRTPRTEATDLKVTLRGGYALLTGKSYIEFAWTTHDNKGFVETLFTAVWEKHDGDWKIAAYASTPLPA